MEKFIKSIVQTSKPRRSCDAMEWDTALFNQRDIEQENNTLINSRG